MDECLYQLIPDAGAQFCIVECQYVCLNVGFEVL